MPGKLYRPPSLRRRVLDYNFKRKMAASLAAAKRKPAVLNLNNSAEKKASTENLLMLTHDESSTSAASSQEESSENLVTSSQDENSENVKENSAPLAEKYFSLFKFMRYFMFRSPSCPNEEKENDNSVLRRTKSLSNINSENDSLATKNGGVTTLFTNGDCLEPMQINETRKRRKRSRQSPFRTLFDKTKTKDDVSNQIHLSNLRITVARTKQDLEEPPLKKGKMEMSADSS